MRLIGSFEVLPSFHNLLLRLCLPFPEYCFQELSLCSIPEIQDYPLWCERDKKWLAASKHDGIALRSVTFPSLSVEDQKVYATSHDLSKKDDFSYLWDHFEELIPPLQRDGKYFNLIDVQPVIKLEPRAVTWIYTLLLKRLTDLALLTPDVKSNTSFLKTLSSRQCLCSGVCG